MKSHTNIAANIRKLRLNSELTQLQLAKEIGRNSMEISHWESGRRIPSAINLIRLAEALHVTIDELVS